MINKQGFTLMELLVVMVILGILLSMGVPMYHNHILRAKFTEIKLLAQPLKLKVEETYLTKGKDGVESLSKEEFASGLVNSSDTIKEITVKNGKITIKGTDAVQKLTYSLNPEFPKDSVFGLIRWHEGGSCIKHSAC